MKAYLITFRDKLFSEASIAPLAFFRIVFGLVMAISMVRFIAKGWVESLYIQPKIYFPFYGFEWIKPLGSLGMYLLFCLLIAAALGIAVGLFYKFSTWLFFLGFTYVELIDKSNYLNHYYFISIVALLLCLVPAHKNYSLDAKFGFTRTQTSIPYLFIFIFQLQLLIVYFYAGIAKINTDWLMDAMPLRLWLPVKYDIPVIGNWLTELWVAYFFSWAGMLYDVLIPFLLFNRRTVYLALFLVVVFHILTAVIFPIIGMFPFIMMMAVLLFLPEGFHNKVLGKFFITQQSRETDFKFLGNKLIYGCLILHFFLQIIVPLRFALYPGKLFWTEDGYRFSWRVMLMEKAGYATFTVVDKSKGLVKEINNGEYLTAQQEKMMVTQADMMLQFAHYLNKEYRDLGYPNTEVYVDSYVTLNGRPSKRYISKEVDLTKVKESFAPKSWVLPFKENE